MATLNNIFKIHRSIKNQKKISWKILRALELAAEKRIDLEIVCGDILSRLQLGFYTVCSDMYVSIMGDFFRRKI